jgi:hypothetical protein
MRAFINLMSLQLYYNLNSLFLKIREESMPTFMILISHQNPSDFLNPNSKKFISNFKLSINLDATKFEQKSKFRLGRTATR